MKGGIQMCVYFTAYDWFSLGLGIVGSALCVYLFALNGWNIEETLFEEVEK